MGLWKCWLLESLHWPMFLYDELSRSWFHLSWLVSDGGNEGVFGEECDSNLCTCVHVARAQKQLVYGGSKLVALSPSV